MLLGLTFRAVEVAEADKFALRGEALRKAIDRDAAEGFVPFFVIATVGTTSTGAVDYIAEIGEVCASRARSFSYPRELMVIVKQYPTSFLHVDGAVGCSMYFMGIGLIHSGPESHTPCLTGGTSCGWPSWSNTPTRSAPTCTNGVWSVLTAVSGRVSYASEGRADLSALFFVRDRRNLTDAFDVTPVGA